MNNNLSKNKKIIGCCGIVCNECPAFLATEKNNSEMKNKTAKSWSKYFGKNIAPDEINCWGCHIQNKPHFTYWDDCKIRKCSNSKNLKNCAYCKNYPCEKLNKFHEWCSYAKPTLEKIRVGPQFKN